MPRALTLLLALPLLCALGCASSAKPGADDSAAATALLGSPVARSLPAFTATGQPAAWSDIVSTAASADVIIIAENHGHDRGLASAAALWDDVLKSRPTAVLALEFFERDEQADVDDYLAGITDEKAFRTAAKKAHSSAYPPGHRAMVESAKAAKRPVIAANAPRRYVRLARTDGYDKLRTLTPEQQRLFRIPDTQASDKYRADFDEIMNANASVTDAQKADPNYAAQRKSDLDATFRSQWMWDTTMAESVVRALDLGSPVMLVVGNFHANFEGGTVQMIKRLRPGARIVVVSYDMAAPPSGGKLPTSENARADFIIYAGEKSSN